MKTFRLGGVHPEENKLTAGKPIEKLAVPKVVYIPLSQHLGAPAKPLVAKGDAVKTGQIIAKGEAFISANIHSPVTGKVKSIDNVADQSGYKRPAIIIDAENDEWVENIDLSPEIIRTCDLTSEEIIAKIQEMGIVGMGGATFPTHIKLKVPQGKKAEVLIINGVECEPYLTSDHRLMIEHPEEVLIGVQLLMKGLQVSRAIIGIENNKPDAIALLSKLAVNYQGIEVCGLKVKYPQGAEKQLIKALVNREVPSGKLPIEVGCVVQNVGTAYAVYEAITKNKPLIERVVTVTGKHLSNPCNLLVRIGTPINELVEKAGGLPETSGKVISGGPMMGKALNALDAPVTKGTSGIVVLEQKEAKRVRVYNCIRCAKCTHVCPMGLEPYLLSALSEAGNFEATEKEHILDCIECGSCQFECPSGRPLLDMVRLGKFKTNQLIRSRNS